MLQVCMHTCADLIQSVPFLEDAEDDFVRYLVTQLHPTVSVYDDPVCWLSCMIKAGQCSWQCLCSIESYMTCALVSRLHTCCWSLYLAQMDCTNTCA